MHHLLREFDAIVYVRLHHLGNYFTEADVCHDAPVSRILHFTRSVGLLKG
jgi:hypothetical protein